MDVAYIGNTLRDFLSEAVAEIKREFIGEHDVERDKTPIVVHYTSLRTLFSMLHGGVELRLGQADVDLGGEARGSPSLREGKPASHAQEPTGPVTEAHASATAHGNGRTSIDRRYLRLYDCANLNDPLEGAYFLKELVGTQDTLDIVKHVVQVPAYIASFVTPKTKTKTKTDAKSDASDNLVFWRHYSQEGRGCSISIPVGRFASVQCEATLQKVIYGCDAATRNARRLRPVLDCLRGIVQSAPEDRRRLVQQQIAATVLECLGEIPYLYKSSAYRYEEECRVVAMESHLEKHGGILYDFETRPEGLGRLRMYGQHPCLGLTNILATDSVITLGPSIPNVDYVQYAIQQLLRSIGIRGLKVEQSGISYRQT